MDITHPPLGPVIVGISEMIFTASREFAQEQANPRLDPDASSEYIAERKNFILELRRIRNELENLYTGAFV